MNKPAINLIVALPPEAKPINHHLGLQRDNRFDKYPIYHNNNISLIISGYGSEKSASASECLYLINGQRNNDIWINIGIAGHPNHEVGSVFIANQIEDFETGDCWTIAQGDDLPCAYEKIITVSKPHTEYSLNAVVEMEAAGFYRSASNYTDPSRIFCLKIISDNQNNPTETINGKTVSQLIRKNLDVLDKLITKASQAGE